MDQNNTQNPDNPSHTTAPETEGRLLGIATPKVDHRANNFDFIRLTLAVLVLYSHSFALFYGHECDQLIRATHGDLSFGFFAVNGFFAVSGFLVAQSWLRSKGLFDFAKRRFLRIYPGFFVVLIVGMLVVGPLSGVNLHAYFHNPDTYRYLTNIFLTYRKLPGAFPTNPNPWEINGSLWTIRYEIICYIGLAILGMTHLLRRRSVAVLWLLGFAFWVFLRIHPINLTFTGETTRLERFANFFMPGVGNPEQMMRLVVFFLTGSLFALWNERNRYTNFGIAISLIFLIAANFFHMIWYALPVFETYLLFAIAFNPQIPLQRIGKNGDFSYGVYLYAFPIQQLLIHYFASELTVFTFFITALPLTLIVAYLSWHLVEHPALLLRSSSRTSHAASS